MKKLKRIGLLCLVAVLSLSVLAGCSNDGNQEDNTKENVSDNTENKKVTIGYVNWADCIAMTELAKVVLEDKMGYEVETTMGETGVIVTSVADGDTDFFLDLWLPVTHKDYDDQYGDKYIKLGKNYENAKIGLAVPEYVEINSLEEMNSVKDKFDKKIVGIDAGAGVMQTTEKVIEDYNLDYNLMTGSGPVMTASLGDAIDNEEWIAVTAWAPHWKFAKWDLKFLEDPKNIYGGSETAYTIARPDIKEDLPEVAEFMENFYLELDEIGEVMKRIEEGNDTEEAVKSWISDNEDLVNSWIPKK